jgi:hypothetical protein
MLSSLDVIWATRVGEGGRTERRYLDFVIDGVTLCSRFSADFIPALGWLALEEQLATIERLTRKIPPNLAYNRTSLCICPECSDLGCGVISVSVEGGAGVVEWKDFGIQNNYEDLVHRQGFEGIGPFTFDGARYHALFTRVRFQIVNGGS